MTTEFPPFIVKNLLAGAMVFATGCSLPGIKELTEPLADSHQTAVMLNPHFQLTETRLELKRHGISIHKNPAKAAVALEQKLSPSPSLSSRLALAELQNDAAGQSATSRREDRSAAMGYALSAARTAFPAITLPQIPGALHDQNLLLKLYNHNSGQVALWMQEAHPDWDQPLSISGNSHPFELRLERGTEALVDPDLIHELQPASHLKVKGFEKRQTQHGAGAPLVGYLVNPADTPEPNPFLPQIGLTIPITATLNFPERTSHHAILAYRDVLTSDRAVLGGTEVTLAADFTAPVAAFVDRRPVKRFGWKALRHPEEYLDQMALQLLQPFNPEKIPLVFVHGLMSSPATWRDIVTALYSDRVIRENYQFLAFQYPSGFPILFSATGLRERLNEFREYYDPSRNTPAMRRMVLVGHSMGGVLSNLQIREGGDALWEGALSMPSGQQELSAELREKLRPVVYFDPNPDIERVVFLCAPHRGSDIADDPIGMLASALVSIPFTFLRINDWPILGDVTTDLGMEIFSLSQNSIQDLREQSPILTGALALPPNPRTHLHSIIARDGFKRLEKSSDGVVAYRSAHLEGVDSETIVSANHAFATNSLETIEELRRILYLHIGAAQ